MSWVTPGISSYVFYGPIFYKTMENIEHLDKDLGHSDRTRWGTGLCWWSSVGKWLGRVDLLPFSLLLSGCFFNFPLRYFLGNREISGQKASIKEGFMTFCYLKLRALSFNAILTPLFFFLFKSVSVMLHFSLPPLSYQLQVVCWEGRIFKLHVPLR